MLEILEKKHLFLAINLDYKSRDFRVAPQTLIDRARSDWRGLSYDLSNVGEKVAPCPVMRLFFNHLKRIDVLHRLEEHYGRKIYCPAI